MTGTALTLDPQLWPLEHDYYAQPYFNEFEWERHRAHHPCERAWRPECEVEIAGVCVDCHDPTHPRPRVPQLWHWLEVYFDLTDDLIASHITGRWLALADWKADMDTAMMRLPKRVQKAIRYMWEGHGLSDTARVYFYGDQVEALRVLKMASSFLRSATMMNLKPGITSRLGKDNALQRPRQTENGGEGSGAASSCPGTGGVAVGPDHASARPTAGATPGGAGRK